MTAQGSAYMRFRRAFDRGNVTEALSAASELQFVALAEALELTLLLADGDLEKYNRAALRWHVRFVEETTNVDIRESQAVLALLTAIPVNRLAAAALAELLSRRQSRNHYRGTCAFQPQLRFSIQLNENPANPKLTGAITPDPSLPGAIRLPATIEIILESLTSFTIQ